MMSWGCTSPHRRASASSTRSCQRSALHWRWCKRTVPSCCSRCPSRRGSASSTRSCPRSIPHWRSCSLPARTGSARSPVSIESDSMHPARSSSPLGCLGSPWRSWMMSWGCTSPHRRASASSTRSCQRSALHWRWCKRTVPSCCSRCPSRRASASSTRSCPRSIPHWRSCTRSAPSGSAMSRGSMGSGWRIRSHPRSAQRSRSCTRSAPSGSAKCPWHMGSGWRIRSHPRIGLEWPQCNSTARSDSANYRRGTQSRSRSPRGEHADRLGLPHMSPLLLLGTGPMGRGGRNLSARTG